MKTQSKGPFQLFYEYLYVIVIITAVAIGSAYLITNSMKPQYRSQARYFLPNVTDTVSLTSEAGNIPTSPMLPTANADFQDSLLGILNAADTRALVGTRVPQRNSDWLKKNVKFEIDRFNLITITAYDPDASMAFTVASEYLRTFQEKLDSSTKERVAARLQTFADGIVRENQLIQELEAERLAFMNKHGAIDFASELAQLSQRQVDLENKISSNQTSLAALEERRAEMERQKEIRPETTESSSTMVTNPLLEELKRNLASAKLDRATLALQYREKHPTLVAKDKEIKTLEEEIASIESVVRGSATLTPDSLRKDLDSRLVDLELSKASLTKEGELYAQSLESTKARRLELSVLQAELESLESKIKAARTTLTNYRDRKAELELYLARNPSFLLVPEYPSVAPSPYYPILWVNLLVATVLGLSLAICVVLIMNQVRFSREAELW